MKKITFSIKSNLKVEQSFLIPDDFEIDQNDLLKAYETVLEFNGLQSDSDIFSSDDPIKLVRCVDNLLINWKPNPQIQAIRVSNNLDTWSFDMYLKNNHLNQLKSRAVCAQLFDEHFFDEEFKYFKHFIFIIQSQFVDDTFSFNDAFIMWHEIKVKFIERETRFDLRLAALFKDEISNYLNA